jgi:hypothetical protein
MQYRVISLRLFSLSLGLSALVGLHEKPGLAASTTRPAARSEARLVALDTITEWDTFIREFRRAVARRDRTALKQIMPKTFLFSLEDDYSGDARDAAFRKWDDPRVRGWQALDRILAKGSCVDPEVPGLMVSPPQWITDNRHYMDYRAGFDRRDGYWRWVWFLEGE